MEDALRGYKKLCKLVYINSLNPCCNGRCSASDNERASCSPQGEVLILVVMEDALRAKKKRNGNDKKSDVLILVVMEDALRDIVRVSCADYSLRLNPCCNGRCSASR